MSNAPEGFDEHITLITGLIDQTGDDALRVKLLDAIEVLVRNMNGPWYGAFVGWQFGDVPDDLTGIDGLEDA